VKTTIQTSLRKQRALAAALALTDEANAARVQTGAQGFIEGLQNKG